MIFGLAAVVMAVGTYLWVVPGIAETMVRAKMTSVSERTGHPIRFERLELLGGSKVVLHNVKVGHRPELNQKRPFLSTPRLGVEVDILAAALGDTRLDKVTLTRPTFHIVRTEDGASDLDPLIVMVDEKLDGESDKDSKKLTSRKLPDVEIRDGIITIEDHFTPDPDGDSSRDDGRIMALFRSQPIPVRKVGDLEMTATFADGRTGPGTSLSLEGRIVEEASQTGPLGLPETFSFRAKRLEPSDEDEQETPAPWLLQGTMEPPLVLDSLPEFAPHLRVSVAGFEIETPGRLALRDLILGETESPRDPFFRAEVLSIEAKALRPSLKKSEIRKLTLSGSQIDIHPTAEGSTNLEAALRPVLDKLHPEAKPRSTPDDGEDAPTGGEETSLPDVESLLRYVALAPESLRVERTTVTLHPRSARDAPMKISEIDASLGHDLLVGRLNTKVSFMVQNGRFELEGHVGYKNREIDINVAMDNVDVGTLRTRLARVLPALKRGEFLKKGKVTGKVALVHASGSPQWTFNTNLKARNFTLEHPKLATTPVEDLSFDIFGNLSYHTETGDLHLTQAGFTLGGATVRASVDVLGIGEGHSKAPVDLKTAKINLAMKPASAQDIFDAVPFALRDRLEGTTFEGKVGFTFSADIDARKIGEMKTESEVTLKSFDITKFNEETDVRKLLDGFTHTVIQPETDYEFTVFTSRESHRWTSLENVSPYLAKAITTNEDGSFYKHKGFSWYQVKKTIEKNLKERRFVRGASTVSMQLIKNVFLSSEKTISRKLQEVFLTYAMEEVVEVPKDRILEIYLNIIEWGPHTYGIRGAARHYFGKRPKELSLAESVFLISIIPGPRKYHKYYKSGGISDAWWDRMKRLLGSMLDRNKITQEEYDDAIKARPPFFYGDGFKPLGPVPKIPILEDDEITPTGSFRDKLFKK